MEKVFALRVLDYILVLSCCQVLRKNIGCLVLIILHLNHAKVIAVYELGITVVQISLNHSSKRVWRFVSIQLIEQCLIKVILPLILNRCELISLHFLKRNLIHVRTFVLVKDETKLTHSVHLLPTPVVVERVYNWPFCVYREWFQLLND